MPSTHSRGKLIARFAPGREQTPSGTAALAAAFDRLLEEFERSPR